MPPAGPGPGGERGAPPNGARRRVPAAAEGPRPGPAVGGRAQPAKFSAYSLRTSGSVTKSIGTVPSTAGPPLRPAAEA
ncbi:hypothetical protein GCM10010495_70570 [Kitasatospora herbaricolor]|nr:hypothetical protein GCM10010495_70570 [Kitasatospora herbaricolor]